jgi:ankyrin repeat protein
VEYLYASNPESATLIICGPEALLEWAVEAGRVELVRTLLRNGVNIEGRMGTWPREDGEGSYYCYDIPLCRAATYRNFQMVKLLVEAGANPNQDGSRGYFYPLWCAVDVGDYKIVEYLVKHGADASKGTGYEYPKDCAFSFAYSKGYMRMVEFMVTNGLNREAILTRALLSGDMKMARYLLARGADPNKRYQLKGSYRSGTIFHDYDSAMEMAVCANDKSSSFRILGFLMDNGGDPDKSIYGSAGLLEKAAISGNNGAARHLLNKGVNPEGCNGGAAGLLERVAIIGNTVFEEELVRRGVKPDLSSIGGSIIYGSLDDVMSVVSRNPNIVRQPIWNLVYPVQLAYCLAEYDKVKYLADLGPEMGFKIVPGNPGPPRIYPRKGFTGIAEPVEKEKAINAEWERSTTYIRKKYMEFSGVTPLNPAVK